MEKSKRPVMCGGHRRPGEQITIAAARPVPPTPAVQRGRAA